MLRHGAPRNLPSLPIILADLGQPSAAQLAAFLGVSRRSVFRWFLAGTAPRPVLLALYWLTRWGHSEIECQAVNDARHQSGLADCLRRENAALKADLARVVALACLDSANRPVWRDLGPAAMPARPVLRLVSGGSSAPAPGAHPD